SWAASVAWNATISSGFGPPPRKETISRQRLLALDHRRYSPSLRISARWSRSGSNCLANSSETSIVSCIAEEDYSRLVIGQSEFSDLPTFRHFLAGSSCEEAGA